MLQIVLIPQDFSHGFTHLPDWQTLNSGQSMLPFGHRPSFRHPSVYGSPMWLAGHLHTYPDVGLASHTAVAWHEDSSHTSTGSHDISAMGSGRKPGGHWQNGLCPSARHTAFAPHVSWSHKSMHECDCRSHICVCGQSSLYTHGTRRQPVSAYGSPAYGPAGHWHCAT